MQFNKCWVPCLARWARSTHSERWDPIPLWTSTPIYSRSDWTGRLSSSPLTNHRGFVPSHLLFPTTCQTWKKSLNVSRQSWPPRAAQAHGCCGPEVMMQGSERNSTVGKRTRRGKCCDAENSTGAQPGSGVVAWCSPASTPCLLCLPLTWQARAK